MGSCSSAEYERLKVENEALRRRLAELSAGGGDLSRQGLSEEDPDLLTLYHEEFMDFLYVVTHDLRSPLVNIGGLAAELRLALQDLEPLRAPAAITLPDAQARRALAAISKDMPETLEHIESSVSKMNSLMSQLAELSRLTRNSLDFSAVDLGEMIAVIVREMGEEIREKSCEVEVGELPMVRGDRLALERIFTHLIGNAVKFLQPGRAGKVKVSGWADPAQACVTVSDNGRGIAEKDMRRIFQPFRRVDGLDTPGDGMGLAIVKALLRPHRGFITCASNPGEGSVFSVTLPEHGWVNDGAREMARQSGEGRHSTCL